jgi:hypothetical protein
MKRMMTLLMAGLAAACVAADEPVELSAATEAELAEALVGRTAGPPASCVIQRDIRHTRTVADGTMLFEGVGDVVWVNRPAGGCPALRFGRAFRTRTPSTRLCRGDIMTVFDPVSGVEFAGCSLADFVPYRRVG